MLKTKIIYFLLGVVVGVIGFLGFLWLHHQYKLYQAKHREPSSVPVPYYHPTGSAEHPSL
jgi:hypothetical protein